MCIFYLQQEAFVKMKYGSWPKHLFLFAVFDNHCKAEHTDLSTVIRVQYNNASRGRLTTAG
jgi:hypothetical protein